MGNRTVELPSGATAVLRDPLTVTNRERKPILRALAANGASDPLGNLDTADIIVRVMVESWSYPGKGIPSSLPAESCLDEIPAIDADRLRVAVMEPESSMFLDVSGNPADPKAPRAGSGD